MIYGLRRDLREVGEAMFHGYSRTDGDPSLAGTLAKVAGLGLMTSATAVASRRFIETPRQSTGIKAMAMVIASAYAAGRVSDGVHDFAYSVQRGQADIAPEA